MAFIFPPFPPLCISLCTPLRPLEDFIGKRQGSNFPDDKPNPSHICRTTLHMHHSIAESPPKNLEKKRRNVMYIKSYLRVMVTKGVAIVPKFLHLSSSDGTTILSPFSPYVSLLMPTMWNFSWQKKPPWM